MWQLNAKVQTSKNYPLVQAINTFIHLIEQYTVNKIVHKQAITSLRFYNYCNIVNNNDNNRPT